MDAYGHVNSVTFLRYLEEARADLLFRSFAERGFASLSQGCVVARQEADYLRPLEHWHKPVAVEAWVTKMTVGSFTIAYEVKDDDAVYLRASTDIVPYVVAERRPRKLSREERELLRTCMDDDDPAAPDTSVALSRRGRRARRARETEKSPGWHLGSRLITQRLPDRGP